MASEINSLLQRSMEFENVIFSLLESCQFNRDERSQLVIGLCSLAFEHGGALRWMLATVRPTSCVAMLRLQYEALVRDLWLQYAASDSDVAKLIAPLTNESAPRQCPLNPNDEPAS